MRRLFFMICILVTTSVYAQVSNDCANQVLKIPDWSKLSSNVMECLNSNADFTFGISILCESDRAQLSMPFEQYLKYEKNYQDALEVSQNTPNPTELMRTRVTQAKEDWNILGNRAQLFVVLDKIRMRYLACSDSK